MKRPRITIFQSDNNLSRLDPYLARMGFFGEFFSKSKYLKKALQESVPDLLLVDRELTDNRDGCQGMAALSEDIAGLCPVLLVEKTADGFLFLDRQCQQELHLVDLHEYFRENLNSYSRKHLRLTVDLPSLLSSGDSPQVARISSLSAGGALVKANYPIPEEGTPVDMTISLLGHYAELDISGRVTYEVAPSPRNHYTPSIGICFEQPGDAAIKRINEYLSFSLADDPSYNFMG